jgi:hypothetical protein
VSPPIEAVAVPVAGIDAEADVILHMWGMEIRLTASWVDVAAPYRVGVPTRLGPVDAGFECSPRRARRPLLHHLTRGRRTTAGISRASPILP